jgi:hypothetical protein
VGKAPAPDLDDGEQETGESAPEPARVDRAEGRRRDKHGPRSLPLERHGQELVSRDHPLVQSSAKAAQTGKAIQSATPVKIRPAPLEAGRFGSTRTSRLLGFQVVTTTSLGKEKRASYQQRQGRSGRLRIELRRRRRLPPLSPQRIRRLDVDS